ncbi:hypothetical protein PHYPSEUDO_002427 [Phytophthora pseudosyringae]|uniref:Uncharacterized protein n=1 Tax=Phytophthora pseudosyringae TaxID=221518 RepID=A0A8T1VXD2_9STRA|nr:hypothetical protein PHYPSEUDO_002427 [Phytophthora pseudosyringae]
MAEEEVSDVEAEMAPQALERAIRTPSPQGSHPHPQTQLQRLQLLRPKAKVAKYRAQAMEAELVAETLAARIKLQALGVPDDGNLPMTPHLLECPRAPLQVKQQWQELRNISSRLSVLPSELPLNREAASNTDPAVPSEPDASTVETHVEETSQTQIQLELLQLRAKVALYQARAVEAQFMAETLAARINMQGLGVPENEMKQGLPPLWTP